MMVAAAAAVSRGARTQWKQIAAFTDVAVLGRGRSAGSGPLVQGQLVTSHLRSYNSSSTLGSALARSLPSLQSAPSWLSGRANVGAAGDVTDDGGHFEGEGEIGEDKGEEEYIRERPLTPLELMLQNAPRRSQRFIMQKALKIKSEGEDEERAFRQGFDMKVIDVNRTVKVTKGGKVQSFTALVITGNHDGVVGFGKGKASEVGLAVDRASLKALSNLHYFERFQGHTIFHEHDSKFEKTKIYLWPGRSGTGMRASTTVGGILRLAGYKNVKSKVVGSRHPLNTVKAVFQTLSEIESPEEVAERRGRIVVESHLVADPL